ncbi:MAG: hypothetical protein ACLPSO_06185 [Terracidiphilus sp.]
MGGSTSDAIGINNSGQVVGYSDASSGYHAFLYANGAMTDRNGPRISDSNLS